MVAGRRDSILVFTPDSALARKLRRALDTSTAPALELECVESLSAAVRRLERSAGSRGPREGM